LAKIDFRLITAGFLLKQELYSSTSNLPFFFPFGTCRAIPIALIATAFAYCWTLDAAEVYATLIEATFDLHRHLLYQALRWELPKNPKEECRVGKQLTDYLWLGKVVE
jgi:hypothetical protein